MKNAAALIAVVLVVFWTEVSAQNTPLQGPPQVDIGSERHAVKAATIDCVIEAAEQAGVASNVLLAIASVENGKNGQVAHNTNGTFDIGHFQINTMHWDANGLFGEGSAIRKDDVAWRGCYNADIAAWMLQLVLAENSSQDYWTKAANYHSRTPKYNRIYRSKLIRYANEWAQWLEQNYHVVESSTR